jgi:phosphatidylglycerol:prolipoprotein diacylglycerol transferase
MIAALPFPNISPELVSFDIFGFTLAIRWYALAYIAGFIFAWWWINRLLSRPALWPNDTPPMTKQHVEDGLTWVVIGVIVGGRIGYVLFCNFDGFLAEPSRIYKVWEGGMSFHGGFAGLIIACLLYMRRHGINAWSAGDAVAPSACIGLLLGRFANFINAELWGRPTDAPWGVIFPGEAAQACGQAFGTLCARHPSQIYEALLEGALLFAIMAWLILRRGWLKHPGRMIGVFFIGYGVARTFVEGFRQADAQFITLDNPLGHIIRFGEAGLTMGQVLSLPMIVIGIVILALRWRA